MIKLSYTIITVFLVSCTSQIPEGYTPYKTFDEYKLIGINSNNGELGNPYVAVKKTKNTVIVKICNRNEKDDRFIIYINNGKYWYNEKREQTDPKLYDTTLWDTVPHYTEKYIFNDTIMEYSYYLERNRKNKYSETLEFITKKNSIEFSSSLILGEKSIDKFEQLKNTIVNYKNSTPYYISNIHQNKYYNFYNKRLEGDTLFIYEKSDHSIYKLGCLYKAIILNSLGEFDKEHGTSITSGIKEKERCK